MRAGFKPRPCGTRVDKPVRIATIATTITGSAAHHFELRCARGAPRDDAPLDSKGVRHGRHHQARSDQDHRRGHQSALQLGPPSAGARHHGGRFRGARRLPAHAPLPARARPSRARSVRPRRAPALRRQQYPLRHLDQDRRVGARQAFALGAPGARRRPHFVGLRLGRHAPQALCAVAQAGELQGRPGRPARHRRSRLRI